mgnify:CR=1 FL=1
MSLWFVSVMGLAFAASPSATPPADTARPAAPPAPSTPDAPSTTPSAPGTDPSPEADATESPYVLDFTMDSIEGKPIALSQFKGEVLLIVNVASRCGYTPQYRGLEKIYRERQKQGFSVLGFPANNFNEQEPGSNADIQRFCTTEYGVTFPMFAKISVVGADQHPLYRRLSRQPRPIGGNPEWNFTKFLVDRNGNVVAKFGSKVKPDDPQLLRRIDDLLAQPRPDDAKPGEAGKDPASSTPGAPAAAPKP